MLDRRSTFPFLVAVVAIAAGCGGDQAGPPVPGLMSGWGNATVLGGEGVLTYAFTLDPADLEQLEINGPREIYVPAHLVVSGMEVGTVGLRFKGAAGTLDPCFENGVQVCPKVSFKAKFDHVDPNLRFTGLKRLNFHSMLDDESLMHERLNAYLFAKMDIVAPRVTHGFLTINGRSEGLFAVVEDVDGRFTEDRWMGAGNGNLYKDAWPVGIEPGDYLGTLETNQTMPDHTRMVAFAQALMTAPPAEAPRVVDKWANIDYLMRFLAVDQAVLNYDGVTAFYCDSSGGSCSNHNYFWYQSQTEERFWLIPWDLGVSLALSHPFDAVPLWDRPPADCNQRLSVEGGVVMPPSCDPLFRALNAAGRPAYTAALDRLLTVWDVAALSRMLDAWATEIQNAVSIDPHGPGLIAWRGALRSLKRDLVALRERITLLKDRANAEPFTLPAPGSTSFEGLTALPVLLGMSSEHNPKSAAVHFLNGEGAISGSGDVRLDFELANDTNNPQESAFLQFVSWRLAVQPPGDLFDSKQIKLRMRADNIRTVRIELDSKLYPEPETPRYGWTIIVPRQATDFTLDLLTPKLPGGGSQGVVPLDEVIQQVRGLLITPEPRGRGDNGLFPAGKTDVGFLEIDDVQIQ